MSDEAEARCAHGGAAPPRAGGAYNGMIKPLLNMTIFGAIWCTLHPSRASPPARPPCPGLGLAARPPWLAGADRDCVVGSTVDQGESNQNDPYGRLNYRTAARTLFLRPYLAHFCSFFRRFFAVCSVKTPEIRRVAPEDPGSVP